MSIDHLLIHRCTVQRLTLTNSGQGRFAEDYADHLTRRPCRISLTTMQSREQMEGEQQKTYTLMTAYFAPGTDIARNDLITSVQREDGTPDTNNYRITGVVQPSKRHHLKATAELIQLGA